MKLTAFLALIPLTLCQSVSATPPVRVAFDAVVTYSAPDSGFPSIGSTINGQAGFSYSPGDYTSTSYGTTFLTSYTYTSPYQLFLDFGTSQITSNSFAITVDDNATFFGPSPHDAVEFGMKSQAVSYLVTLVGPADSFSGTSIPSPEQLSTFWESAFVDVYSPSRETLLQANVSQVTVTSVPEPSTVWFLVGGLVALGFRVFRSPRLSTLVQLPIATSA
jgi:hypothetical protein